MSKNTWIRCSSGAHISLIAAAVEFTLISAESGMGLITVELHQLPDDAIELATSAANLQNDYHTVKNEEKYALLGQS